MGVKGGKRKGRVSLSPTTSSVEALNSLPSIFTQIHLLTLENGNLSKRYISKRNHFKYILINICLPNFPCMQDVQWLTCLKYGLSAPQGPDISIWYPPSLFSRSRRCRKQHIFDYQGEQFAFTWKCLLHVVSALTTQQNWWFIQYEQALLCIIKGRRDISIFSIKICKVEILNLRNCKILRCHQNK